MWIVIVGIIVALIGAVILFCVTEEDFKCFGLVAVVVGLACASIPSAIVMNNRGKPVALGDLPFSLSQGTVYTALGAIDGYAIITDDSETKYTYTSGSPVKSVWLIELMQTNVVMGKRYMIADVPDPTDSRQSRILIEIKQK